MAIGRGGEVKGGYVRWAFGSGGSSSHVRIIANALNSAFDDIDSDLMVEVGKETRAWADKANTMIPGIIRDTMHARSGGMQKIKLRPLYASVEERKIVFRASSGDPKIDEYAGTQEVGRKTGGSTGRYYMVPLASWLLQSTGSKYGPTDPQDVYNDLAHPDTFWLNKKVQTSMGMARLVLRYKQTVRGGSRTKAAKRMRQRKDKIGRRVSKGSLSTIAWAMYLAYDKKSTGVFGTSTKFRKVPAAVSMDFAAAINLSKSNQDAPRWFSQVAARTLPMLYRTLTSSRFSHSVSSGKRSTGRVIQASIE